MVCLERFDEMAGNWTRSGRIIGRRLRGGVGIGGHTNRRLPLEERGQHQRIRIGERDLTREQLRKVWTGTSMG
jgi:hypothetical protein